MTDATLDEQLKVLSEHFQQSPDRFVKFGDVIWFFPYTPLQIAGEEPVLS